MSVFSWTAIVAAAAMAWAAPQAWAAERHFSFGYDQPHTTAYGFAADTFAAKLKELSKGQMIIDQFPGAQLGQEPQMLQKITYRRHRFHHLCHRERGDRVARSRGALDPFHLPGRGPPEEGDQRSQGGRRVSQDDHGYGQGSQSLTLITLGLRDFYSKKEIHNVGDAEGAQDPRAGDADRGHAVHRLWRSGRAHAVWRGLHFAADRGRRRRRERHQCLSLE